MEAEMIIKRKYLIHLEDDEPEWLARVLEECISEAESADETKATVGEIHLAQRLLTILRQR